MGRHQTAALRRDRCDSNVRAEVGTLQAQARQEAMAETMTMMMMEIPTWNYFVAGEGATWQMRNEDEQRG